MDIDSQAFHKVLKTCDGRTTYWHIKVGMNPSGQERNEIDDYKKDDNQEEIDAKGEELNDIKQLATYLSH